jgi:hypothetical protein
MSEIEDVVRWSADPDAPEGMRDLLRAANSAEAGPTPVELANLRGRMAAQLAPKVSTTAALLSVRTILVSLVVVGIGTAIVGYVVSRPDHRDEHVVPAITSTPVPPPAPLTAPVVSPPIVIAEPPVAELPKPRVRLAPAKPHASPAAAEPAAPEPAPPVAPSAPPTISEVALLEQARAALRAGDTAHALVLVEQDATLYPDGVLVEEREALAIETLIKLGRRDEAVAKWTKFATSYPHSNYHARLQRLITP